MFWGDTKAYIFPPFGLITKVLAKLEQDQTHSIMLIFFFWKTQPWYPRLQKLLTAIPLLQPKSHKLLSIPKAKIIHPMWSYITQLIACNLSVKVYITTNFQKTLRSLYSYHGEHLHECSINQFMRSGTNSTLKNRLILFNPL